jgi:hypothetical protein
MLIILLLLLLSCTPAPEYQWEYRQERRELTEQDTVPVLSPLYGAWCECVQTQDFYLTTKRVQVQHISTVTGIGNTMDNRPIKCDYVTIITNQTEE